MIPLFRAIDTLSEWFGRLAIVMLVVLVVAMVGEVFMRYVLDRPTDWALETTVMSYGALFMLGAAYAMIAITVVAVLPPMFSVATLAAPSTWHASAVPRT